MVTQIAATAPGMVALENRGRKRTQYVVETSQSKSQVTTSKTNDNLTVVSRGGKTEVDILER